MSRRSWFALLAAVWLTNLSACLEDDEPDAAVSPDGGSVSADASDRDAALDAALDAAPMQDGGMLDAGALDGGDPPGTCRLGVRPHSLGFGAVELGRRAALPLRLDNSGDARCELGVATLSGAGLSLLSEVPATLDPGASLLLDLAFDADTAGAVSGSLSIGPASERQRIELTATATATPLRILPGTVQLENTANECRNTRSIVLTSDRPDLRITEARLDDGSSDAFTVGVGGFPITLSPDGSFALTVAYAPLAPGSDAARLLVFHEGSATPNVIGLWGSATAEATVTERFPPLAQKVDVLFVIDDSPSMVEEQDALVGAARVVLEQLSGHAVDYRIGATTTDPARAGALMEVGGRRWVSGADADPEAAFIALVRAIGTAGAGTEAGLEAAYLALSGPSLAGANAGFLRSDASLAVVVLSDEEDLSARQSTIYTRFLSELKPRDRQLSATLSALVMFPSDAMNCAGVGASPGTRYLDVARDTGGSIASICSADWLRALLPVARVLAGERVFFPVRGTPEAPSVEVSVDGAPVTTGWSWNAVARAVRFEAGASPAVGANVEIRYTPQCP